MQNRHIILILQSITLFPFEEVKIELKNEISKYIVDEAINRYDKEIVLVTPKSEDEEISSLKDINSLGLLVKIKSVINLPNGCQRVTLRGLKRVQIDGLYTVGPNIIEVTLGSVENPVYNLEEELARVRILKSAVEEYSESGLSVAPYIGEVIKNTSNLSKLTDIIAASVNFDFTRKCELLNETNYYKRADMLLKFLKSEVASYAIESRLEEEIHSQYEKREREIIIKDKIKVLTNELDNPDEENNEALEFEKTIRGLKIDKKIKDSLLREVKRFSKTMDNSPEYGGLRTYLEFVTSLPWNKSSKILVDIEKIDEQLNELHYGLAKAKERIEEYMILKMQNKNLPSPILCLIGPPGTGKTTFARELASSAHREFVKVSVGGLNDSGELVGHRRTYIGAGPGKIMEGIRKCGTNNPVILIDEVDKMVKDYKGDPSSTLLDILDQNQNREFIDNYVQEPFDLSNVLFILTANDEAKIPRALFDRLEVIEVASYTLFDKIEIAKNYTLPRLGKEYGFDHKLIKISDDVLAKIVTLYTREAGVRDLERKIACIIRKVLIKGLDKQVNIKESDLVNYLGVGIYSGYVNFYDTPGVCNVPACTTVGGCILNIETSLISGPEKVISTGSLGKVMQESTLVAVDYLKTNYKQLKIDAKKLETTIHVHALDGATPKDGPSAGLAIAVCLVSSLLNRKVANEIAFTGEISLKGRILKVGGIKEKLISAYNAGIKIIYMPKENEEDLTKLPVKICKGMDIILVNDFTEVYSAVFK